MHVCDYVVAFSCTVSRNDWEWDLFLIWVSQGFSKDDWVKLKRVLKYLKRTRKLNLGLSVGEMSVVKWWLEYLYVVHKDCRGHNKDMMPLEKIHMSSLSTKIYTNGNRSTQEQLIGVDTTMAKILWPG